MPERRLYVGIDPGLAGGLAWLGDRVGAIPTPETELGILKKLTRLWDNDCQSFVVLEEIPPAFFGNAKSSMAKLYGSYMAWRMALTAVGFSFETVRAKVWQPGLGIERRRKGEKDNRWKNRLRNVAGKLYPKLRPTLGTADAILLAEFCRRYHEGKL